MKHPLSLMGIRWLHLLTQGHRSLVLAQGLWADGPEGPPSRQATETKATIPYFGYVEVNLQIPGIRGYNWDVMLLVISNMTYAEKVPVMVGSKNYWQGNGDNYKGKLAMVTQPGGKPTWLLAYWGHSSCPLNMQGWMGPQEGDTHSNCLWPHCT